jgi:hypothetical protein
VVGVGKIDHQNLYSDEYLSLHIKSKGNFCFGCRPGTKQNVSGVEIASDVT